MNATEISTERAGTDRGCICPIQHDSVLDLWGALSQATPHDCTLNSSRHDVQRKEKGGSAVNQSVMEKA